MRGADGDEMVSDRHVSIVTGAGGGIGASIAGALAAEGYQVIVNDRDGDRAREVCRRLNADHPALPAAYPHAGDITDPAAVADLSEPPGSAPATTSRGSSHFSPRPRTLSSPVSRFR